MQGNIVKEKLRRGEPSIGCISGLYSPQLAEMIGLAGYDFYIVDDEHGAFGWLQVEEMIRAASYAGLVPIVRTDYDPSSIQKVLDRGGRGVQIPMVSTREDAERVVERAKYPPAGKRGTAFSTRAAGYGFRGGVEYMNAADADSLVIVHIETPEAVDNFEAIMTVPGIDVAFVGPLDLCVNMGYKAEGIGHPAVQENIRLVYEKAKRLGVPVGTIAATREEIEAALDLGATFVAVVATAVIKNAFGALLQPLNREKE